MELGYCQLARPRNPYSESFFSFYFLSFSSRQKVFVGEEAQLYIDFTLFQW